MSYRRPKAKEKLISLTKKVSSHILMIRNPKAFEALSIYSYWALSVIKGLGIKHYTNFGWSLQKVFLQPHLGRE